MNNNLPIACFEKVSFEQFVKDMIACGLAPESVSDEELRDVYDAVQLPERKTEGSAGYDFHVPVDVSIPETPSDVLIPTGIRVKIDKGWFLMCAPRSGLGFKYGMKLQNTVGVIDSDYYHATNEGHIMAKVSADHDFKLRAGDRFMQGIFMIYGTSSNGNLYNTRTGGFGSTGIN